MPLLKYQTVKHPEALKIDRYLVILHGFLGSGGNWKSFARKWVTVHPSDLVILPDLRNHGDSFHDDKMNYKVMAEDVIETIQHFLKNDESAISPDIATELKESHRPLDTQKMILMGHSMGGKTALEVIRNIQDIQNQDIQKKALIDQLIVIDMAIGDRLTKEEFNLPVDERPAKSEAESIVRELVHLDLSQFITRNEIVEKIRKMISNPLIANFLGKSIKYSDGCYLWKFNLPVFEREINFIYRKIDLDEIDVPTLFVKGMASDLINLYEQARIREVFKEVKITEIEGGHWLNQDNPDGLFKVINDFADDDFPTI